MNHKELYQSYLKNKESFHCYINKIKYNAKFDIYTIINSTLIKNPYNTKFPIKFFLMDFPKKSSYLFSFIKNIIKFYKRYYLFFINYFFQFILFKILYKKKKLSFSDKDILVDVFLSLNTSNKLNDTYFTGLSNILKEHNKNCIFIARLLFIQEDYSSLKDFTKFIKFSNSSKQDILFEHELLSLKDFITLFYLISVYPFKTLRLLQKSTNKIDDLFNHELLNDINIVSFKAFSRYIFGKNISKFKNINRIYLWCEHQVIERSFNYGIRQHNKNIELIGCQFLINFETYFNSYIDDLDFEMKSSPHKVLVNGNYYLLNRKKVKYEIGVSLRYKKLFQYNYKREGNKILILGSYIYEDTLFMINSMKEFKNVIFKPHPTMDIHKLGKIPNNIIISNQNIYELFKTTQIAIGNASGTSVEAVSCQIPMIIIPSKDMILPNTLISYGKGEIWDVAFSDTDIKKVYSNLINYNNKYPNRIKNISNWYKKEFFTEPNHQNIIQTFNLDL